jgi:hypothetical protein
MQCTIPVILDDKSVGFEWGSFRLANVKSAIVNVVFIMFQKKCVFSFKVIYTIANANNRITSSKMSDVRATGIRIEPPKFCGLDLAFGIANNAFVGSIFAA